MEERVFYLPDQENHFISGRALEKLLRRADGGAALLYLYILQQKGRLDLSEAMEALRLEEQEVRHAVGVLANLGLVSGAGVSSFDNKKKDLPEKEELPQYTGAEIKREIGEDASFGALIKEVEGILGKILTAPDLNILMGIYRHLGLPPEVIYQLVSHLTKEHREKYGPAKSPTLRGIEKVAYIWTKSEILTLEAAMAHIQRREAQRSQIGQLKKAMDIKQDKLTPTQEKYLFTWLNMGFDPEVIALAYDKTVVATGSLKWNYMHAILKKWHEKGLLTLDAVDKAEGRKSPDPNPRHSKAERTSAPNRDEIARKRKLLEQMDGH